jgi:hypothetical protein
MLPLWSFQGAREPAPALHENDQPEGRSLKTQQRTRCRGRRCFQASPITRRTEVHQGAGRLQE